MGIAQEPLPQLISGRELQKNGFVGKEIGTQLKRLRQKQIQGEIQNTESAQKWLQTISSKNTPTKKSPSKIKR